MHTSFTAGGIKAIRASASDVSGQTMLLISGSDMNGNIVSVTMTLELGDAGADLAEAVAKTINEHPGNGGFLLPGFPENDAG